MKILYIDKNNPDKNILNNAKDALKAGKTVVYPTDTCLGIAANVFREDAVENVFLLKQRPREKPMSVIFPSLGEAEKYVEIDDFSREIMNKRLPGPFTFVLRKKDSFPGFFSESEFLGIRIPNDEISLFLAKDFPITTTSANVSGDKPSYSLSETKVKADIFLDAGTLKPNPPSTVIKIHNKKIEVLRGHDLFAEVLNSNHKS